MLSINPSDKQCMCRTVQVDATGARPSERPHRDAISCLFPAKLSLVSLFSFQDARPPPTGRPPHLPNDMLSIYLEEKPVEVHD